MYTECFGVSDLFVRMIKTDPSNGASDRKKSMFGRLEQDPTSEKVGKTLESIHSEPSGKVVFWCVSFDPLCF